MSTSEAGMGASASKSSSTLQAGALTAQLPEMGVIAGQAAATTDVKEYESVLGSEFKKCEVHPIDLDCGRYAVFCPEVLSPKECRSLIQLIEKTGFEPALVNIGGGHQMKDTSVRNNDRCMVDCPEFASQLFHRIKHALPEKFKGARAVGANERLRFLRYYPGQYFAPHYDGLFRRDDGSGEFSMITLQLYLNGDCEGGATTFMGEKPGNPEEDVPVIPQMGSVLLFEHKILHEGSVLKKGVKYAMRTDIMFTHREEDADSGYSSA
uniref:Fe2OG dioxygenase domain-containing protein n=1 Tax=Chromera velia CCMP2878 TaxID=1169474 RepID=A0A0G4GJD5_9ALVE|eukprot:Cvel_4787.t1-p1 / transcript=Cvel_4787.t1 / gene=Cvel_4787 / organism=Chromera_velia_CCMP2878 / gene_product=hypothetical protein / transcript_product=hypothetical protein / location=Cvel_scaffold214:12739-13707(-) / protein_length=265 / sequence_SO=supercontig / SO=protein_coding / is_pseudo=false